MIQMLFQIWFQIILIITPTKITTLGFDYVRFYAPTLFYFLLNSYNKPIVKNWLHLFSEKKTKAQNGSHSW